MKEVVHTKSPYMNSSEQRIADMHSVLNILNVVAGELSLIEPRQRELSERFMQLDGEFRKITREIKEGGNLIELMRKMRKSADEAINFARSALEHEEGGRFSRIAEIKDSLSNLKSISAILHVRLDELEERAEDPDVWVRMSPEVFRHQLEEVFAAVAKNSKGKYGIRFDRSHQEKGDYLIDLEIGVDLPGGHLWMPLRLIDIFRDLTANARKYTAPGGHVALSLHQDEKMIRGVVEDNGYGIPDDEIERVAEFGYRASNVRRLPTFGGGYGLTKAVWLVTEWGGTFTIQSEVDTGTIIRFSFPNAELPENPRIWKVKQYD